MIIMITILIIIKIINNLHGLEISRVRSGGV